MCNATTMSSLNDDCLIKIFNFLSIVDRIRIERVCKRWRAITKRAWSTTKILHFKKSFWGFDRSINNSILNAVLLRCSRYLIRVDIAKPSRYVLKVDSYEGILTAVIKYKCKIKQLSFKYPGLTPSGLSLLTSNCCELEEVSLYIDGNMDEKELSEFFDMRKNLKRVEFIITKDSRIKGEFLNKLSPDIHGIGLVMSGIIPLELSEVFQRYKKLSKLSLSNCKIDGLLNILERWDLKDFEMICCYFTDDYRKEDVFKLPNLERLVVKFSMWVDDDFLITVVNHCKQISHLDIKGCHLVTDEGLSAVTSLSRLKHLELGFMDKITGKGFVKMVSLNYFKSVDCVSLEEVELCNLLGSATNLSILKLYGRHKCIGSQFLRVATKSTRGRERGFPLTIYILGQISSELIDTYKDMSPLLIMKNLC